MTAKRIALTLAFTAGVLLFLGLGIWQIQRLVWKTALIAQVETQLAAAPAPSPAPPEWPGIGAEQEYTRVVIIGTYDYSAEVLVQAVTERGPGYWVMTPLKTDASWTVLINRGFVPQSRTEPADRSAPSGLQTVAGLLRNTQPGGAFLRSNDPAAGRWYSRDTAAIAAAQGLGIVAPYFIDAAANPDPKALPYGGMTVVKFRNTHLSYALTWFVLALGVAGTGLALSHPRVQALLRKE